MRQLYNESAFLARVNFAEKCFRSHQTNTRAMDTCFEMYDGAAVVVALVRRARLDHALYVAIASDWSGKFPTEWLELETKYSHIPTERLDNLARELRATAKARELGAAFLAGAGLSQTEHTERRRCNLEPPPAPPNTVPAPWGGREGPSGPLPAPIPTRRLTAFGRASPLAPNAKIRHEAPTT